MAIFFINGYHAPYKEDRTYKGGGLLLYIREHIPCKRINDNFCPNIEAVIIEINFKKSKWLHIGTYNPHKI